MKPIQNIVVVELEETHKTKIGSLYLDPGYNPEQYVNITGTVVEVPHIMSKEYPYKYISPDVEVGDTLYFHYLAIHDDARIPAPHNQGKLRYCIDYQQIFLAIRKDEVIPIGGWCVSRPVFDLKTKKIDVNGKELTVTVTESGLIASADPNHSLKIAELLYIGKPMSHQPKLDVNPGDRVVYMKDCDFKNSIEGEDLFIMHQEELLAVI